MKRILFILLLIFITGCSIDNDNSSTNIKDMQNKYGKIVDCYYYFGSYTSFSENTRYNIIVFEDSLETITEKRVTEGVYHVISSKLTKKTGFINK
jgi:hypothetical protein